MKLYAKRVFGKKISPELIKFCQMGPKYNIINY